MERRLATTGGTLRPLLCALLYAVLAFWLLSADELPGPLVRRAATALEATDLSPTSVAFYETINLLTAVLLTFLFGLFEGRRVDDYGLPVREAFGRRFWEGFAVGVANAGVVALGMLLLGGMTVQGLALQGSAIPWAAFAWLCANLLVGVAEEYLFRGYLLQSLWRGLGFWPAAVLIALWFGADHYFFKRGENIWDLLTLVSLGVWCCYTVLRTGTLWMAVGYHAAFDYMQLFVIGSPNGSVTPVHRLLQSSFDGPAWVNGGVLGTEASFLMYPCVVLMFLYVWRRRFRGTPGGAVARPSLRVGNRRAAVTGATRNDGS